MNKFLVEILEQTNSLKRTFEFYATNAGKVQLEKVMNLFHSNHSREIILTGMGSSYFTSYLTSCLLNELGVRSFAVNASELLHYHFSLISKDTMLVCVSQSGASYEIIKIIEKLDSNITWIAITNEESSPLALKSPMTLFSKAGHEEMTSSKTYSSIALTMLILGWTLAGKWTDNRKDALNPLINVFSNLLGNFHTWLPEMTEFLGDFSFVEMIGRGPSFSSVLQGALMFKEAVRSPAEGILGGDFRHGPMEMVKEGFRAIVFAPQGKTYEQNLIMAIDIARFGGKVLVLTNRYTDVEDPNIHVFNIPVDDEYLFAIGSIIPLQFIVNFRAIDLGLEPGYFTRGAKVTKKE